MTTTSARSSVARPADWWPAGWGPAPRYATRRSPELGTWGPNAGKMAERMGRPFFAFQQYVADVALEVTEEGGWRYQEVYVLAPRRSGKTFMEQAVVATVAMAKPSLIVMTAQTRDKAKDRWKDVCSNPITGGYNANPFMSRRVKVTTGTGNERCLWHDTGSVFSPFSPNEDSGHGDQIDQVWVDELWSFSLQERDAIQTGYEPSGLVGNLQVWHLSAAGTSRSAWLKEAREIGRRATQDPGSRVAYFEWGLDEESASLEGGELVAAIMARHPRAGLGLREEFLVGQIETRSKARVLRDYGNIDADDGAGAMCVTEAQWKKHEADSRIPAGSTVCIGVAQDDDRRESTVAVGWGRPDGTIQTDTVVSKPGVRWAEAYVADMAATQDIASVAVVNAKIGRGLATAVEKLDDGPPVIRVASVDLVAASQEWMAALTETATAGDDGGGMAHDGSRALRDALTAGHVPAGKALVSVSGEPVTAGVAHILARLAVRQAPQRPKRHEFRIY